MTDGSPEGLRPPPPPDSQNADNKNQPQQTQRTGWLKQGLSRLGLLHNLRGSTPEQTLHYLADEKPKSAENVEGKVAHQPATGTNIEARTRLVDTIDRTKVVEAFAAQTIDIRTRILATMDYVRNHGPAQLRQQVLTNFETFLATYTDEAGKPNTQALENLAGTLVSKVDIISINELLNTARTVVDSNDSEEVVLFIPSEEAREADFSSQNSSNSNEFMAKLVSRYAQQQGKHVVLVTDYEDLGRYNKVNVVDDAIYSGSQLSSRFTEIARKIKHHTQLQLYCARSTDAGMDQVRQAAGRNRNIRFEPHIGQKLLNLQEALTDSPETLNFFFASGLIPILEHPEDRPSLHEAYEYANNYVASTTLTISETKTPDFLSFPSRLAAGMTRATEHNDYPSIDSLNW